MNDFSKDLKFNEKYNPIIIVLNREREHLYERINKRVDIMMDNGLIDEVKNLLKMGYTKDMIFIFIFLRVQHQKMDQVLV